MKVTEEALLASGFSLRELQLIKNTIKRYNGTLDEAIRDLANRFNGARLVTGTLFIILVLVLMLASEDASITFTATFIIVLSFIWFITPITLGYKSLRYRKLMLNSELNQHE